MGNIKKLHHAEIWQRGAQLRSRLEDLDGATEALVLEGARDIISDLAKLDLLAAV